MKGKPAFAWIFVLFFVTVAAHGQSTIDSVRFWTAPDNTRLVFDASEVPKHQVFLLDNPRRLVIDINDARLKATLKQPPKDHPIFSNIRSGIRNGYDLRIVVDLKVSVRPKSFSLKPNRSYGHRLVVDLFHQTFASDQPPVRMSATTRPVPRAPISKAPKSVARSAPPPRPRVTAQQPLRDIVVAIDAGHGGEDPGAHGRLGTNEKDVVLSIARKLKALLASEPGMRGVMIRDGDYYVGLRKRMELARKARADLFVSIHADAFNDSSVRGSSVFTLSGKGASSEAARWLADRENAADLAGGVSLDDKDDLLASVLFDLSQTATQEASQEVARMVLRKIGRVGRLHQHRVQNAGFVVLKSPDIPSILVETAFISNPEEERKLRSGSHQQQIARAVFDGIREFFSLRPPPGTRLAMRPRHVISEGETLSGIAAFYGVSMQALRRHNALSGNVIRVGQVLEIPSDG